MNRRRIQRELERNPAWRVRAGQAWLCPYCADPVTRPPDPELPPDLDFLEQVCDHLGLCLRWKRFDGTALPVTELRRKARGLKNRSRIREALLRRPSWQLYDLSRRWYCPFCAQATSVRVKPGGRISSSVLREIEEHLIECVAYDHGRGDERPVEQIQRVVGYANRTQKMAEEVRAKIERDAVWRLRDTRGRWVCPFCRLVLEHIDFSSSEQMLHTAPLDIARHLVGGCERFRSGPAPLARPAAPPATSPRLRRIRSTDSPVVFPSPDLARLDRASTTEIVSLSGPPPIEVSGELNSILDSDPDLGLQDSGRLPRPRAEHESASARVEEVLSGARVPSASGPRTSPHAGAPALGETPARGVELSLSGENPSAPEVVGVEVRRLQRTAGADPNDVLEVIPLDDGRLAIAVGTISTDGSDRGLFLPLVRNFLKVRVRGTPDSPKAALVAVDQDTAIGQAGRLVLSVTLAVIDPKGRQVRFARAGGHAPLLYRAAHGDARTLDSGGMVLGLQRGGILRDVLEERTEPLEPGDLVILYSRGAIAAEDVRHREIGQASFAKLVRRYGRHEADYFMVKYRRFLESWTRGAALTQDVSVVALKLT